LKTGPAEGNNLTAETALKIQRNAWIDHGWIAGWLYINGWFTFVSTLPTLQLGWLQRQAYW
jgi:hypothetical protein